MGKRDDQNQHIIKRTTARLYGWATWVVMLPIFALAVVFAMHNKSSIVLDLWPFGLLLELPLYLALFGAVGVGVLLGGLVAWLGQGRVRSNLRGQKYEGEVARRELKSEQEKVETLQRDVKVLKDIND